MMGFLHRESLYQDSLCKTPSFSTESRCKWGTDLADHLHHLVWSSFPREAKDCPGNSKGEEEVGSSFQDRDEYPPRDPSTLLQSKAEMCMQLYPSSSSSSQLDFSPRQGFAFPNCPVTSLAPACEVPGACRSAVLMWQ